MPEPGEREEMEYYYLMGTEFQFKEIKSALRVGAGDDCTTM